MESVPALKKNPQNSFLRAYIYFLHLDHRLFTTEMVINSILSSLFTAFSNYRTLKFAIIPILQQEQEIRKNNAVNWPPSIQPYFDLRWAPSEAV